MNQEKRKIKSKNEFVRNHAVRFLGTRNVNSSNRMMNTGQKEVSNIEHMIFLKTKKKIYIMHKNSLQEFYRPNELYECLRRKAG